MAKRWRYSSSYSVKVVTIPNCDGLVHNIKLMYDLYDLTPEEKTEVLTILNEIEKHNKVLPKKRLYELRQQLERIRSGHQR